MVRSCGSGTGAGDTSIAAFLAGVLLVIALVVLLVKKLRRKEGGQMQISYGFVISAWLGFGFIMALLRWQPWGSRLMYPALAVTVLAGVHILGAFCHRMKKKEIVIIPLALLSLILCFAPLEYNMKQAKSYLAGGCENRTKFYFENNKRYSSYKQLLKKVKAMNRDVQGDFFKLPQFLFKEQKYEGLSDRAKIFYSMLCNKLSLSLKNEWRDEDGDTYLYFSVSEATKILGASHSTISKIYAELEKAGLIFREKPSLLA